MKSLDDRILDDLAGTQAILDRMACEDSLREFVSQAWPVLEPSTPLVSGRVLDVLCDELQAVTEGRRHRLLVNCPPGCSKSILVNVLWPAWEWGPRSLNHHRFISASYAQTLATRDMVRCRDLLRSDWFQARWPLTLKEDQDQKTYYENDGTGWRFACGVGGSLTGHRGDRAIVDDPHDVLGAESEAEREGALRWFAETLSTRYNDERTFAVVVVMQRLHTRDISGLILDKMPHYRHVMLPMEYEPGRRCDIDWRKEPGELLWPERFSAEGVRALKDSLSAHGGEYAVAGQLQQRPIPREGGMFPRAMARFVDAPPAAARRCRGWDLAGTRSGKATVAAKVSIDDDGRVYVEDVVRIRGEVHEVEQLVRDLHAGDPAQLPFSLPQDPGQAGKAQVASLARLLHGRIAHFSPETGDKGTRAMPLSAQWKAGNVYVVRGPWNDQALAELELHPNGQFSDVGDALTRAYAYLLLRREARVPRAPGRLFTA